jgi:hypothetical protein
MRSQRRSGSSRSWGEPTDTPEEAADNSRRLAAAEREVEELRQQIDEAQADWERAQADWLAGPDDDDAGEDDDEALSVEDAADIWFSNGMDEDYMFGYTEDEFAARRRGLATDDGQARSRCPEGSNGRDCPRASTSIGGTVAPNCS